MKIPVALSLFASLIAPGQACASEPDPGTRPEALRAVPVVAPAPLKLVVQEAPATDALHAAFTAIVAEHVRDGVVDYAALAPDTAALDAYIAALGRSTPASLSRAETFAFWINAYNAFTLRLILDYHGKIESIKDISSGKRWKHERWKIDGKTYSLDQIEHEILRPMGDPRIHFALNCASTGCPDLRSEAYLAATLDAQLDDATRRFLADESKGLRVATEKGFFGGEDRNLYLSSLFDWFEEDFEKQDDNVVNFVLRYAPVEAVRYIREHRSDLDVEHMSYDWSLNDR